MLKARHVMAAAGLLFPTGVWAQAPMVSAADPEGLAAALSGAGYTVSQDIDDYDDPALNVNFDGYDGQIVFYGCDETAHDNCDSVLFVVALDRPQPMPLAMVNDIVNSHRFVAISLDNEGDPWITWDVVTLDGIPQKVFLNALRQFSSEVAEVADTVFAKDEEWQIEPTSGPVG